MNNHNNPIGIYNGKNKYVKSVYSRYATQQVIKGKAKWIKNKTAIQLIPAHIITRIFASVGISFSIAAAMAQLAALFPNDPFAKKKAAGALGGASRSGFINLNSNGMWVRVR